MIKNQLKEIVEKSFIQKADSGDVIFTAEQTKKLYMERYTTELAEIQEAGLEEFLLIVADAISFAKEKGIAVIARGTVGGSLVAYLLGISEIDPMKYDLLFERFLNSQHSNQYRTEGIKLRIDFNITTRRIKEVKEYLETKWAGILLLETDWPLVKFRYKEIAFLGLLRSDDQKCLETMECEIRKAEPNFQYKNIPLDDKEVYDMLGSGEAENLFRWEKVLLREFLRLMKPKTQQDLAVALGLTGFGTNGPVFDQVIPEYLGLRKQGEEDWIKSLDPDVGLHYVIFQEQLIVIISKNFGCSLKKADVLWGYLMRRDEFQIDKSGEIINEYLEILSKKGYTKEQAERLINSIWRKSRFTNLKSHVLLESLTLYRIAYFRRYYPEIFDRVSRSIYYEFRYDLW